MKNTISPSDYFEIRKVSLINAKDFEYALDLYAPLVGIKNISVYFALIGEESGVLMKHSDFLLKYRLSSGEFAGALSYLEAVGLIASYCKESDGIKRYAYAIMAPRTPSQFFNNELLYGTLRSNISEDECKKIGHKYMMDDLPADYENVSEKFVDVFHPDLENGTNIQSGPKTGERRFGSLALGFDFNIFREELYRINPHLKMSFFSKEEIEKVKNISALYLYEEKSIASFVNESYKPNNPLGKRIDFEHFSELAHDNSGKTYLLKKELIQTDSDVHGSSNRSKIIRKMDKMTPIMFLSVLQDGNAIADPDLKLIDEIKEMGLPNNVINALLYFVLTTQNNMLSGNYVKKLAGSLSRERCTNALDAIDYLEKNKKGTNRKNTIDQKLVIEKNKSSINELKSEEEEELSDEEIEELCRNL